MNTPNTYTCAICHQNFTKGQDDETAIAETKEYFTSVNLDDCAIVCEDCFERIRPEKHPTEYKASLLDMWLRKNI
jgi:hypothetical protein